MTSRDIVRVYDGVISVDICKSIIEGFDRNEEMVEPSQLEGAVIPRSRSSDQIQLTLDKLVTLYDQRAEEIHKVVRDSLERTVREYNDDLLGAIDRLEPWGFNQIDILKYKKGFGEYKTHIDTDGREGLDRMFSVVLYLNDVEEGGETYFPLQDISVRPKAGRIAIFPSNFAFPHKACIPGSGDKYVIVAWASRCNQATINGDIKI